MCFSGLFSWICHFSFSLTFFFLFLFFKKKGYSPCSMSLHMSTQMSVVSENQSTRIDDKCFLLHLFPKMYFKISLSVNYCSWHSYPYTYFNIKSLPLNPKFHVLGQFFLALSIPDYSVLPKLLSSEKHFSHFHFINKMAIYQKFS